MKYSEIRTMEDLEKAQRSVRTRLTDKGDSIRSSFIGAKEAYTPSNMLMSGLRSFSSIIPVDQMLLLLVNALRRRIMKK